MSQITLVRHGQAQTEARDEIGYDKLSPLGHQQARWLGEHLTRAPLTPVRVYCGTLVRQIETAEGLGLITPDSIQRDARLNEIEYFALAALFQDQHGTRIPANREDFVSHFPQLLTAWRAEKIAGAPESFSCFENRTRAVIEDIATGDGPAVVVTSGGVIGMILRQIIGLELDAMSRLCLAIMNTSVHHLHPIGAALAVTQFNAVPHLDSPDRHHALTHL